MAGKKNFNPPAKNSNKPDNPLKKTTAQAPVSLTNEQYEEIFNAVLHPSQNAIAMKSPVIGTAADFSNLNKAASPKESASVENSQSTPQNSQPEYIVKEKEIKKITIAAPLSKKQESSSISTLHSKDITKNAVFSTPEPKIETFREALISLKQKKNDSSEVASLDKQESSSISTLHSEDITKNAVFSTPKPKMKTFREALISLKQKMNDSSEGASLDTSIQNASLVDLFADGPLSQAPAESNRRQRLLWLQQRRGTGLYAKCDNVSCRKWRWLEEPDPVDVPSKWFCCMNPDKSYASCSVPEKPISIYIEDDLIHNCYTAGSIVWAKVPGYPWWPGMVDDCPDTEQYYWINNELDDVPDWYHVVFFDEHAVTRSWMLVKDLKSFKHCPNLDIKFDLKQSYKRRMNVAKQKANHALTLHVKDRLKKYSFISIWDKAIPEYPDSDVSDSGIVDTDPIKKKIIARRRALAIDLKKSSTQSTISNDPSSSAKSPNLNRRIKNGSGISEKFANVTNRVKKDSQKSATRKAYKNSEKSARVTRRMSTDSDISDKPAKITRRMSADSAVSENSKRSEKSVRVTRTMSADSDISDKHAKIHRMNREFETHVDEVVSSPQIKKKQKMGPMKVTKPGKPKTIISGARRNSEKTFSQSKGITSNRRTSSASVPEEVASVIEETPVKISKRKTISNPTFFKEFKKKDEDMAKRQKQYEEKMQPSKIENIIKNVKKSFRPPIKPTFKSSSVPEEVASVIEETPVMISRRKSVSSPTFFGEKKDEEMDKRQTQYEEKMQPSKKENITKKVKKSFRPPIKTTLNTSLSTSLTLSFNDFC